MAKKKPIEASTCRLWICESGHLHITMFDEGGREIATGALSEEDTIEQVFDLADYLIEILDEDADDGAPDPTDTIGQTVGNA